MKIIGIDPSLVATGYAESNSSGELVDTLKVPGKGESRLNAINQALYLRCLTPTPADLVVMEGLSFGARSTSAHELAGLHWIIRTALWRASQEFVVVAPSLLKKFTTGKGNAPKEVMMREVFKRWGIDAYDNNQADSYGLMRIGMCLKGVVEPETKAQREVLAKLKGSEAE